VTSRLGTGKTITFLQCKSSQRKIERCWEEGLRLTLCFRDQRDGFGYPRVQALHGRMRYLSAEVLLSKHTSYIPSYQQLKFDNRLKLCTPCWIRMPFQAPPEKRHIQIYIEHWAGMSARLASWRKMTQPGEFCW
jgi:hypothetical protein